MQHTKENRENGKSRPNLATSLQIVNYAKEHHVTDSCINRLEIAFSFIGKRVVNGEDIGKLKVDYELLMQLAEEGGTAVYVADDETDELLYINDSGEKIMGVANQNIIGHKCYELFMKGTSICSFCQKKRLEFGKIDSIMVHSPVDNHLCRLRSKLLMWNGRKVHAHYISDETAFSQDRYQIDELNNWTPTGVGIYYLYPDGRMEQGYSNNGYFNIMGTTRERRKKYSGFDAIKAIHIDDRRELKHKLSGIIKGKK